MLEKPLSAKYHKPFSNKVRSRKMEAGSSFFIPLRILLRASNSKLQYLFDKIRDLAYIVVTIIVFCKTK